MKHKKRKKPTMAKTLLVPFLVSVMERVVAPIAAPEPKWLRARRLPKPPSVII